MSSNPWHKRYHSDALHGFMSLTLEERGAFQTLLDLIYDRGGPLIDNARLLSGYMGVSLRKWESLRQSLVEKRKIYVDENGMLSNFRAEKEIENALKTSRKRAENGAKGGRNSGETPKNANENNENDKQLLSKSEAIRARSRSQRLESLSTNVDKAEDSDFWADAKTAIGGKNPGAFLNMCLRDFGQDETRQAITAAQIERAVDPRAYITKILRKSKAAEAMPVC